MISKDDAMSTQNVRTKRFNFPHETKGLKFSNGIGEREGMGCTISRFEGVGCIELRVELLSGFQMIRCSPATTETAMGLQY